MIYIYIYVYPNLSYSFQLPAKLQLMSVSYRFFIISSAFQNCPPSPLGGSVATYFDVQLFALDLHARTTTSITWRRTIVKNEHCMALQNSVSNGRNLHLGH